MAQADSLSTDLNLIMKLDSVCTAGDKTCITTLKHDLIAIAHYL